MTPMEIFTLGLLILVIITIVTAMLVTFIENTDPTEGFFIVIYIIVSSISISFNIIGWLK